MMKEEKRGSPEFYKGILAALYFPFLAALVYCSISGAYLFIHPSLDFRRYFTMKLHIFCGFFIFWTFFPASYAHLKKLYRGSLLRITFLSAACFYILLILELWPQIAFAFSTFLLLYLMALYLRDDRTSGKASIISGIIAWAFFNIVIATGMYVGGPMKTFRTDAYNTLHKVFGLSCIPFIFYHLFIRLSQRLNGKTLFAAFAIVSFNAALLLHGFKQAANTEKKIKQKPSASNSYSSMNAATQKLGGPYSFKNPATCGKTGCHSEIYKEWKMSAHRFSANNIPYKKVFQRFLNEYGGETGLFCERCHNPDVVIFSELAKDKNAHAFFTNNGVSCLSCHLITEADESRGDGIYKIKNDRQYLPGFTPSSRSEWQILHHFIRSDLRVHRKNYKQKLHRKSEFCVTCHRLTIPAELNQAKPVFLSGPFGSYSKSIYPKLGIECTHCHLPLFEFPDPESIEHSFHARPDHRMMGIHAYLSSVTPPALNTKNENAAFQSAVKNFLQGKLNISDYELTFLYYTRDPGYAAHTRFFKNKSALKVDIKTTLLPQKKQNARKLRVTVKTTNQTVGHDFPAGLLDLIDVWLEITVKDKKGKIVFQSGFLNKDGTVDKNARRLGGEEYDKFGNRILDHSIWRLASFKNVRVIAPQKSVDDAFSIILPKLTVFPITLSARWLYRRYNPQFIKWVYGKNAPSIPLVELGSAKKTIPRW